MVSTAFAVGWVLLLVPVTRKLITRFLPGEGVVREERDMFWLNCHWDKCYGRQSSFNNVSLVSEGIIYNSLCIC